ncbi:MAG: methyltransferase, partial [Eubacterium sp.]|nr:methyltransferase [Eubacterium sp.]
MDSVLLANFATIKSGADVADLGTGTGIIPLLLAAKGKGKSWTGIELQPEIAEMAGRSTILNHIEDKCKIVTGDVRNIREMYEPASFGAVTSNPPYMKENSGIKNPSDTKYISRHEAFLSLEEVVSGASYLLKTRGTFSMVHRPSRLPEIMELMRKYRLEPKRMRLVQPYMDKEPNMV